MTGMVKPIGVMDIEICSMISLPGYDSKILLIESKRQSILLKFESFAKLGLLYTKQKCAMWTLNFNHKAEN